MKEAFGILSHHATFIQSHPAPTKVSLSWVFAFFPLFLKEFPSLITFKGESDAFCVPILCALACAIGSPWKETTESLSSTWKFLPTSQLIVSKISKRLLGCHSKPHEKSTSVCDSIREYCSILPALQEVHGKKKRLPQQVSVYRITQKTIKNSCFFKLSASLQSIIWCLKKGY